jgi:hypothetical protein
MRTLEQITTDLTALKATARRYDAGLNEGGEGFTPHADAIRRLEREYDAVAEATAAARMAAIQQAEDAEWTHEVTMARRAAWNAWVQSQGTVTPAQLAAQIKRQGWRIEALKAAIVRHGL